MTKKQDLLNTAVKLSAIVQAADHAIDRIERLTRSNEITPPALPNFELTIRNLREIREDAIAAAETLGVPVELVR